MVQKIRLSLLMAVVLCVAGACASAGSRGGSRVDSRRITEDEIQALQTASTLYDVVSQLRPQWLTARGRNIGGGPGMDSMIGVYDGQTYLGGVDVLREFGPRAVYGMRFLDAATASASLPRQSGIHLEGAIVLITSPPRQ